MNEHDERALKRALDALPRSIEPADDLWPVIRARLSRPARRWYREARLLRIAAGLGLITVLGGILGSQRGRASAWHVAGSAGAPTLDGRPFGASARLAPGDAITTDAVSRAVADVGTIGRVAIAPGTSVRLLAASATEHRLALDHGGIEARITAPPRLFIVETPTGTAVDLGCAYTLAVDSAGNGRLAVTAGWVEYGSRGRQSLVPAGFVVTSSSRGVGLPVRDSASAVFVAAAAAYDDVPGAAALHTVLATATQRDAVTLWHLLARTEGAERERVHARLVAFGPLPDGVSRDAVLRLDDMALRLWWVALPGALPIIPAWTQTLWLWWLRVVG